MVLHIYSSFSKFYSLLALKRPVQKEIRFLDSLLRKNRVKGLVIDIGCGHGVHAHGLSEKGYSVLAVDNSKEQLTLAKKLFSDLQTVQADMIDFVMPENASMVYSLFATIMYAPNVFAVKKVCTNAYVTLRKNGVYVLELPPSLHQIKKYPYQYFCTVQKKACDFF